MHLPTRIVSVLVLGLLGAGSPASTAAPKIEETVLGPANVGGLFTVSPSGGHAAYMGKKGARLYMSVDGVEGPEFDEIYKAAGGGAFFPQKAGVWPGTLGGLAGADAPVLFSLDGSHHAYAGTQVKDYVVIHDGKEIGRGPWELMGRRGLTMSPGGRQVYWTEAKMEQGRNVARTLMTGKAGPWTYGAVTPVFSPDDLHYAIYLGQTVDSSKPALIVDGKPAGYLGQEPVFTADGSLLLTISHEGGSASVLANGKVVLKSSMQVSKIVVAPVGSRYAAIFRQMVQGKPVDYLYIDGKQVLGSEDAQDVWFSPDGKRYAAVCHNPLGGPYSMVVDGKRGPDYARIDERPPYWTADGSKVIYTAGTGTESIVVIEGRNAPVAADVSDITVAGQGNRFAWMSADNGTRRYSVVVGEDSVLPPAVYPTSQFTFSPDGSHYGYLVGPVGRGEITGVVLDGVVQPGITPGLFGSWYKAVNVPLEAPVAFSRDGKHVAFIGRTAAKPANALYLDGTRVYPNARAVFFPTFTPDGNHFIWVADVATQPPQPMLAVFADGREVVRANGYFFQQLPGSWHMDASGVITFLAADGDIAKRYRITPSPETNIASTLADAAAAEAKMVADADAAKKAADEAAAKKKADQAAAAAKAKADYDAAVAAKAKARQDALDAKKKAAEDAAAARAAKVKK